MDIFSELLAFGAGNPPVPGESPAQRPVSRSFDVFFDLPLNKQLSKQSRGRWFETPSRSLWRQRNDDIFMVISLALVQLDDCLIANVAILTNDGIHIFFTMRLCYSNSN